VCELQGLMFCTHYGCHMPMFLGTLSLSTETHGRLGTLSMWFLTGLGTCVAEDS
jgi:hypothetical protein